MRKFLLVALTSLAAVIAHGGEEPSTYASEDNASVQAAAPVETRVLITAPAAPALAEELVSYPSVKPIAQTVKKVRTARLTHVKSLLSRSAREQISLARKPLDDSTSFSVSDDEDDESGLDDLDLHRFYNRPKVVEVAEQAQNADDEAALPAHITLRLFMARTKAVEAHILAHESKADQGNGDELSDAVRNRLREAREKAVAAFVAKYGEA